MKEETLDEVSRRLFQEAGSIHPFTVGAVLRSKKILNKYDKALALKLDERGYPEDTVTVAGTWPETVTVGPFSVGFLPMCALI